MTAGPDAVARLQECYRTRGLSELTSGQPVAGITSNAVPWELLAAARLQPLLLSNRRKATPLADVYMEDVFPRDSAHSSMTCLQAGSAFWIV